MVVVVDLLPSPPLPASTPRAVTHGDGSGCCCLVLSALVLAILAPVLVLFALVAVIVVVVTGVLRHFHWGCRPSLVVVVQDAEVAAALACVFVPVAVARVAPVELLTPLAVSGDRNEEDESKARD